MTKHWRLLEEMRNAYSAGRNASIRGYEVIQASNEQIDSRFVIEYAYELQAGTYIEADSNAWGARGQQARDNVVTELSNWLNDSSTVLEIGVGEGTTLSRILEAHPKLQGFGLDISYSRISHARKLMASKKLQAELFVGDLLQIPLRDNSVDVVYSNHSIEPNGGNEELALRECLRVARKYVVLFEPSYEHADSSSRKRMESYNYIQGLQEAVLRTYGTPLEHRLLKTSENPENPTAITVLSMPSISESNGDSEKSRPGTPWRCPISGEDILPGSYLYAPKAGLAYPTLDDIPLLRPENAVVCLSPEFQ